MTAPVSGSSAYKGAPNMESSMIPAKTNAGRRFRFRFKFHSPLWQGRIRPLTIVSVLLLPGAGRRSQRQTFCSDSPKPFSFSGFSLERTPGCSMRSAPSRHRAGESRRICVEAPENSPHRRQVFLFGTCWFLYYIQNYQICAPISSAKNAVCVKIGP